jgi:excinuclease ABC subunit A
VKKPREKRSKIVSVSKSSELVPSKAPDPQPIVAPAAIGVRGARVHNLRNIDVDLPRDRLVVLTGVSGSGKSSLAFDTIYAEGQRRYLECLSSAARQFLDQLEKPDVDSIEGLPPTVAIDQKAGTPNPRSTLGTITEIYDYLRLLFARVGTPHCPKCDAPIRSQTPEQMVDQLLKLPSGRKVQLLAPLVRDRKGQHLDVFQAIRRAGLIRARVDGEMVEITDTPPKLTKTKAHSIEAVVDRLVIRDGIRPRLAESLDLALKLADGRVLALIEVPKEREGEAPSEPAQSTPPGPAQKTARTEARPPGIDVSPRWDELLLSIHLSCPACGGLPEIEPRTFSFNSPHGACPACQGIGSRGAVSPAVAVPDRSRSWDQGGVLPWTLWKNGVPAPAAHDVPVGEFLSCHGINASTPLESWPPETWQAFWFGDPNGTFPGIAALLERAYEEARSDSLRKALEAYREEVVCAACGGSRLRPEARAVRFQGKAIHELTAMAVNDLLDFFVGRRDVLAGDPIVAPLIDEVVGRLRFLAEVGLDYLSLERSSDTLSGGELQRARLASQLGSGLVGVCYILDEPTAGLHPRDTERLIASLRRLQEMGNSLLVVEHDESVIRGADWVVDLGPGAGPDGGAVVAAGTPEQLANMPNSITGRYLVRQSRAGDAADQRGRLARSPGWIEVRDASVHNLKHVDARIPLGALTCVTGVSGSGKSSLVHDVLARSARRALHRSGGRRGELEGIGGLEAIEQLIEIDQSPIGRTPRSTPGTATGLFDEIRRVFAATREAKIRGYGAARFSFNAKGGRCEVCQGLGRRRIPMHFLPDLYITCEECGGQRFNHQTLEVRFKGKSVGDVLNLRVDESRAFFDAVPRVLHALDALHEVGLGYLTIGQSSTTLSGGEAQRVKLATEFGRTSVGRALYILDEPTTGLHFADIDRLLVILHRLVDRGHTVVVIEHQLDVIAQADWVIDLGPESGDAGGRIVAMGPPQTITTVEESRTGQALCANLGIT